MSGRRKTAGVSERDRKIAALGSGPSRLSLPTLAERFQLSESSIITILAKARLQESQGASL